MAVWYHNIPLAIEWLPYKSISVSMLVIHITIHIDLNSVESRCKDPGTKTEVSTCNMYSLSQHAFVLSGCCQLVCILETTVLQWHVIHVLKSITALAIAKFKDLGEFIPLLFASSAASLPSPTSIDSST